MTDFTEAGVRLIADVSQAESDIQSIIDMVSVFDSPISIDVSADTSEAEADLSSLADETVEPVVAPSYDDSDVLPFEELADEEVEPVVNPTISDDGQTVLDTLKSIELMTAINLVIDIGGSVIGFLSSWADFTAGPLLAIDTGMAEFQARTGAALPNARELITKIMGEDLATGVTQITSVLTTAQQLHLPLEEAATAALTFTKVFPENDPNTVITTLDSMVKNQLMPDLTSSSDLLVKGFQEGANKGGDLIQVLGHNSAQLKDLGLTGPQSLQLITNALDGGAASATDVVTALEKIKQNITTQTIAGKGNALDALSTLGLPNPQTSADGWSAAFFLQLSDALNAYQGTDEQKQQLLTAILGGKLSQKDYEGILNLDAAKGTFDNLAGTGATAATKIDDSLSGAINDFELAAQVAATNFLSSDQIDLPGKIAALKTGIQDGLSALQNGADLGTALTIALKPVGLDQTFMRLEAAVLQFTIAVVNLVAGVQELTGHGDQAAQTRGTASGLAGQKLALDLQINNPEDFLKTVGDALNNGLSAGDYGKALQDGITALVNSGDFVKAQAVLDASKTATVTLAPGSNLDPAAVSGQIQAAQIAAQKMLDDAKMLAAMGDKQAVGNSADIASEMARTHGGNNLSQDSGKIGATLDNTAAKIDTLDTAAKTLTTSTTAAVQPITHLGTSAQTTTPQVSILTTTIGGMAKPFNTVQQASQDVATRATLAAAGIDDIANSSTNAIDAFNFLAGAIENAAAAANGGVATEVPTKTGATGFDDSGGQSFLMGEDGPEIVTSDRSLAVLNGRTTAAIMQAISGAAGRGSVQGGNSSKVVNFTQINNVPDRAVADSLGYNTAQQIRGQ